MNLQIARFFNIPVYLNLYTIPFALFICLGREFGEFSLATFIIGLFFVVLHEYGHCFMAKKYGWKIFDITILPIGGVAQISFKHDKPIREIYVAMAGPAVSLFLCVPFLLLMVGAIYLENYPLMLVFLVCFLTNGMIFLFNLLPIFPMDGGRVLRAILSSKIGHERATWWAVRIGQIGGIILCGVCFYYQLWIAGLIFVLVSLLSQNELAYARLLEVLYRLRIKLACVLNKPELLEADLPELISAVESIQDEEVKKKIQVEEVLDFLKDLTQSSISI